MVLTAAEPAIPTATLNLDTADSIQATNSAPSWREVLGLTSLPPLFTAGFVPDDPLLIHGQSHGHFPWMVLIPLLVGAQHGALAATLSSGLLLGFGGLHQAITGHAQDLPALGAFGAGCLAVGVIAGHFRDRVQAQLARLSQQAAETARRLARLSRSHAVLGLSHQKLEERLAAGSWSLVSAFEETRRELADQASLAAVGEAVLNVLANHAHVQSATLLEVTSVDRRGRIDFAPSASIGQPPALNLEHRLVQRALETGRLVALDAESADGSTEDGVLCVAPLATASGKLLGLVLIHEMPFMAFQAENLKSLAALTALLAEMLEDRFVEARPDAHYLSLVPVRSAPRVSIEPEGAWQDASPESAESDSAVAESSDDFVGTRTGTHRRRGIAQSA